MKENIKWILIGMGAGVVFIAYCELLEFIFK